jgi:hypothetical protein
MVSGHRLRLTPAQRELRDLRIWDPEQTQRFEQIVDLTTIRPTWSKRVENSTIESSSVRRAAISSGLRAEAVG